MPTNHIDWLYDNIGRLTRESYDGYGTALDYIADYTYDLVGNRLTKKTDTDPTFQAIPPTTKRSITSMMLTIGCWLKSSTATPIRRSTRRPPMRMGRTPT